MKAELNKRDRGGKKRLQCPSAVLTLDPALEMETEGLASHPAVISKQRKTWRQQSCIFRSTGTVFPMMCSFKDTDIFMCQTKVWVYSLEKLVLEERDVLKK